MTEHRESNGIALHLSVNFLFSLSSRRLFGVCVRRAPATRGNGNKFVSFSIYLDVCLHLCHFWHDKNRFSNRWCENRQREKEERANKNNRNELASQWWWHASYSSSCLGWMPTNDAQMFSFYLENKRIIVATLNFIASDLALMAFDDGCVTVWAIVNGIRQQYRANARCVVIAKT